MVHGKVRAKSINGIRCVMKRPVTQATEQDSIAYIKPYCNCQFSHLVVLVQRCWSQLNIQDWKMIAFHIFTLPYSLKLSGPSDAHACTVKVRPRGTSEEEERFHLNNRDQRFKIEGLKICNDIY